MLTALREQLGDEDFKALCARVCDEDEPEAEGEDEGEETFVSPEEREMADKPTGDKRRAKDKKTAKDEPAPFEGKPSTGTAMDAASDPRFDYLRDAARVKPSQPGQPGQSCAAELLPAWSQRPPAGTVTASARTPARMVALLSIARRWLWRRTSRAQRADWPFCGACIWAAIARKRQARSYGAR